MKIPINLQEPVELHQLYNLLWVWQQNIKTSVNAESEPHWSQILRWQLTGSHVFRFNLRWRSGEYFTVILSIYTQIWTAAATRDQRLSDFSRFIEESLREKPESHLHLYSLPSTPQREKMGQERKEEEKDRGDKDRRWRKRRGEDPCFCTKTPTLLKESLSH